MKTVVKLWVLLLNNIEGKVVEVEVIDWRIEAGRGDDVLAFYMLIGCYYYFYYFNLIYYYY